MIYPVDSYISFDIQYLDILQNIYCRPLLTRLGNFLHETVHRRIPHLASFAVLVYVADAFSIIRLSVNPGFVYSGSLHIYL